MKLGFGFALFFCLFVAQGASAEILHPFSFDEGFYRGKQIPRAPQRLSEALNASVQLTSPADLECSAAVVSPRGHILTALHCVTDCLKQKGLTRKSHTENYGILEVLDQAPNILCKTYRLEELGTRGARILYTGQGLFYPEDGEAPEAVPHDELERVVNWEEDYAILKVDAETDCIPVAASEPAPGDWVWGIGYPGGARRKNGFSSNGEDEYVRYGEVRAGLNLPLLSGEFSADYVEYLKRRYSSPRLMVTNLDIQNGVSGGMVINEEGSLVGITVEGASQKAGYRDGTSIELRMSFIRDALKRQGADADSIFSCPAR
jgi:hypothetical protein